MTEEDFTQLIEKGLEDLPPDLRSRFQSLRDTSFQINDILPRAWVIAKQGNKLLFYEEDGGGQFCTCRIDVGSDKVFRFEAHGKSLYGAVLNLLK